MKKTIKYSIFASVAIFSVALAFGLQSVSAQTAEERRATAQQTATEAKAMVQTRLEAAKLKVCQNRQKSVTNIMTRIADRGQKQVDLFTTIADRTEKFYTDSGKTLANYDALVANVTTQKTTALTIVNTIKSSSTTFDCTSDDPKGMVTAFKGSLKTEIDALQAYKTAVKNLIVGVKSVQGTISSSNGGQQ